MLFEQKVKNGLALILIKHCFGIKDANQANKAWLGFDENNKEPNFQLVAPSVFHKRTLTSEPYDQGFVFQAFSLLNYLRGLPEYSSRPASQIISLEEIFNGLSDRNFQDRNLPFFEDESLSYHRAISSLISSVDCLVKAHEGLPFELNLYTEMEHDDNGGYFSTVSGSVSVTSEGEQREDIDELEQTCEVLSDEIYDNFCASEIDSITDDQLNIDFAKFSQFKKDLNGFHPLMVIHFCDFLHGNFKAKKEVNDQVVDQPDCGIIDMEALSEAIKN